MKTTKRLHTVRLTLLVCGVSAAMLFAITTARAQQIQALTATKSEEKEDDLEDHWLTKRDEQTGTTLMTRELTIYPQQQPEPALKYRIIPDEFDRVEGNAALFYMKAMGFFEQESARTRVREFIQASVERSQKERSDLSQEPPYVWLDTPPDELPIDEVREYLSLLSFQPGFLEEASKRTKFHLDRDFRNLEDPIAYLLPEIQTLRELARTQSLRCRLAIAENRLDDAFEIIKQQYCLAEHLGQDEFLVSNLVGIAIAGITWNDALYLSEKKGAPNLYWAIASKPRQLVDIRHSMSTERQFLFQQVSVLKEVNETPRPAGYWQDFIDRLIPEIQMLDLVSSDIAPLTRQGDAAAARAILVGYVAASYPGAKRFLIDEMKMPEEKVDEYPTAQVVFLAMVRFHERWRDEVFKWNYIPISQARQKKAFTEVEDRMKAEGDKYGWFAAPTLMLLPAVTAVQNAEARCEQTLALWQTVEALRLYAAAHDNELPPTLESLDVPAPIEPYTGKPINYERINGKAVLNGHALPGMRYRLVIRIAK